MAVRTRPSRRNMDANSRQTQVLHSLRPSQRLAAIASAWPHASEAEHRDFAWQLLQLASPTDTAPGIFSRQAARDALRENATQALGCLAKHWAEIEPEIRQLALVVGRERWERAVSTVSEIEQIASGRSLAELATDANDAALFPPLVATLIHGQTGHVQSAARALLVLALRAASPIDPAILGIDADASLLRPPLDPEPIRWTSGDMRALLGAVAAGVESFDQHSRKEVLLAALVLLEGPRQRRCRPDPLAAIAREPRSPAFAMLRTAFRKGRAPLARQRAWMWLREESLAAACLERLARAQTPEDHRVVLELGHLVLAPARGMRLRNLPVSMRPAPANTRPPHVTAAQRLHPGAAAPDRAMIASLQTTARRQLPRFVAAQRAPDAPTTLALEPLLTDPDPVTRLAACRCAPDSLVADFRFDAAPSVARHAAIRSVSLGRPESTRPRVGIPHRREEAARLARSPHHDARHLGRAEVARLTPGFRSPLSRLAARRLWLADPTAFADWVQEAVADTTAAGVDALMTARSVGAVAQIETLLISILRASMDSPDRRDPRLVATAVACLGELSTSRAVSLLEGCLARHADPRVRSNAAEALGRQRLQPGTHTRNLSTRVGFDDEHHRVRGSVVRAAIMTEAKISGEPAVQAVDTVSEMLTDPGVSHRLAGVWVVQRVLGTGVERALGARWERVIGRVRWLADEDEDAAIRRRATVVTHRVDAAMLGLSPRGAGAMAS